VRSGVGVIDRKLWTTELGDAWPKPCFKLDNNIDIAVMAEVGVNIRVS